MKFVNRLTCLIVLGVCITTALPILAAITLARSQAVESDRQYALDLAQRALARSEITGDQLRAAAVRMQDLTSATACTPRGLDTMRQIDLGSTMLQAVGWIEGNRMRCSSFAGTRAYELGQPDFISAQGSPFRVDVRLVDPDLPYLAVQTGPSIGIVHRDLPLSFVDDVPGLGVAVFSWSHRVPLISRGVVEPKLYSNDRRDGAVFRSGADLVAVVQSKRYDIGAVAVLPAGAGGNYAGQTARVLIPLGVLVGLILSAVLIHVIRHRVSMPMMLRGALRRKQFHLVYQPVIELATGRIAGAEALIRWDRGGAEEISPDVFIAAAEEAGLVHLVTRRMLELLTADAPGVLEIAPNFGFSINLSASDFHRADILDEIGELIARTGMPFSSLRIEATERSLVDVERAQATLRRLRTNGIRVGIDDFGTGYSSLAYLAQLDIDFLKIDKLFVQSLGTDSATSQVASRVIDMARDLDLNIVAEGIETRAQQRLVHALGVQYGQGFLFGRPMSRDDLLRRLRSEPQTLAPLPRSKAA